MEPYDTRAPSFSQRTAQAIANLSDITVAAAAGSLACPPLLHRSMSQPPRHLRLLRRFFVLLQHELAEVCDDIGYQHAAVGGGVHQGEVGVDFGHLGCDLGDIGVVSLQVALQQVVNIAVNALGHFNSFDPTQCSGGSIEPLRSSAAAFGSVMNLMKALATS